MTYKKDDLTKLIQLIVEITNAPENEWFKKDLIGKLAAGHDNVNPSALDDIYEYCIKIIIKDHAEKFYADFKLIDIKEKLISDFVRMEKFRREDNFEDFCLALFQQLEGVINKLSTTEIQIYVKQNSNINTHKVWDKESNENIQQKLWQLIFNPNLDQAKIDKKISTEINYWDFSEKYRAVLFFYYFKKRVKSHIDFQNIFFIGYDLYQARNLNHRGGKLSESQERTVVKVKSNSHRYYFKFLGFLEDITSRINSNI